MNTFFHFVTSPKPLPYSLDMRPILVGPRVTMMRAFWDPTPFCG